MSEHPSEVGESYREHFWFAYKMSWRLYAFAFRLIVSSFLFTIHAALPFIPIPKGFDLLSVGEVGNKFYKEGVQRDAKRQECEARRSGES